MKKVSLKIQHEKLPKCGISTPKNQYHIFNSKRHATVLNFVIVSNDHIFRKKNRQIEDSFAESLL